jgi:hypothetical protein
MAAPFVKLVPAAGSPEVSYQTKALSVELHTVPLFCFRWYGTVRRWRL